MYFQNIKKAVNPGQFRPREDSIGEQSQIEADQLDQLSQLKIDPLMDMNMTPSSSTSPSESIPTTIFRGKVGINTSAPEEALSVVGNVKLTGVVLQPSDIRVKENIEPVGFSHHY